jgi:nucleotide-binding universal stress UspA family protein
MYKRILVGYDGSEGSQTALRHALQLARQIGAEITAIWVRGSLPHYPETVSEVEQENFAAEQFQARIFEQARRISEELGKEIVLRSLSGHPSKIILEAAEDGNFDLIVLGHRGHSGLWGRFLGHTADKISDHAKVSVLIVR